MNEENDLTEIGADLVRVAESWERSPGDMLSELFPYVLEASRKMSTRAISRWLKEAHAVEISQPTISRALRNPAKFLEAFADFVEPVARTIEAGVGARLEDFLFDERLCQCLEEELLRQREGFSEDSDGTVGAAFDFLKSRWFCLSEQTRAQIRPYIQDEPERSQK